MSANRNDWPVWEVLGKSLDYLFYIAAIAFLFALLFEPARNSFLIILVPTLVSLALAIYYFARRG